MAEFSYQKPFPLLRDNTEYRKVSSDYVRTENFNGREILVVDPKALEVLTEEAMSDVSFYLRPSHLEKLRLILDDPEATDNDRFVAYNLLQNAVVAAEGQLPSCQDTGTAIVMAKKGENVYTGVTDEEYISKGIYNTYQERNLRYSQMVPLTMFEEKNSGTNLPAQIDIYSQKGNQYEFLFLAKGGGLPINRSYIRKQNPCSTRLHWKLLYVKKLWIWARQHARRITLHS